MPTPLGHALGGLTAGWAFRATRPADPPRTSPRAASSILWYGLAGMAADIDILFHSHRMYTHSVGAIAIVGMASWLIVRAAPSASSRRARAAFVALSIAAAYGTHVLLDWLGKDTAPPFGLMALWPFSDRFYVSGVGLFMEISRRYWKPGEFIFGNLRAVAWETLLLGPIAALAWYVAGARERRSVGARDRRAAGAQD